MYHLRLENTKNEEVIWTAVPSDKKKLAYKDLIDLILLYEPTADPKNISMMIENEDENQSKQESFKFITKDFQLPLHQLDKIQLHESGQLPPLIKYKIHNDPIITNVTKNDIQESLGELNQLYNNFRDKYDGQTIDIYIYWSSPFYTQSNRKKAQVLPDNKGFLLKYNLEYQSYIREIINKLQKEEKRAYVKINELHPNCIPPKKKFSILYIICHTEEVQKYVSSPSKPPKSPTKRNYGRQQSISEKKEDNHEQQYFGQGLFKKETQSIGIVSNQQFSEQQKIKRMYFSQEIQVNQHSSNSCEIQIKSVERGRSEQSSNDAPENLGKTRSNMKEQLIGNRSEYRNSSHSHKTSSTNKNKTKIQQTYFVGQNKKGELVPVDPDCLADMLKGKDIELLILHTSYPYAHFEKLRKNNNIHNILCINSNPIYKDSSTHYFVRRFFKKIFRAADIQQAHRQALKDVKEEYPNVKMCCCYHYPHNSDCPTQQRKQITRFSVFHYKHHEDRCKCRRASHMIHNCQSKYRSYVEGYLTSNKNKADAIRKQLQEDQKNKKQFFYCCCKDEKNFEKDHGINKKFHLESRSSVSFKFKAGKIKGDIDCLKGFKIEQRLIGNRPVVLKIIQTFTNKTNQIFNLLGPRESGKNVLASHAADILIQKKVFNRIVKREIKKFESLDFDDEDSDKTLYILNYKPDKDHVNNCQIMENIGSLSAILLSQKRILTNCSESSMPYSWLQPLTDQEVQNYFKMKFHITPEMKIKVREFFKMLCEGEKLRKDLLFPEKFDEEAVISTIAQIKFDEPSKEYLRYVSKIISSDTPDTPGIFVRYIVFQEIANAVQASYLTIKSPGCKKMHLNAQKYFKEAKQLNFASYQEQKIIDMKLKNVKIYYKLIYIRYNIEIERILIDLLKCFIKIAHKTIFSNVLGAERVNLYEATIEDTGSLLSLVYDETVRECLQYQIDNKEFEDFVNNIDAVHKIQAGISLVRNVLDSFYIFENHNEANRIQILQLCTVMVNFGVILRKYEVNHQNYKWKFEDEYHEYSEGSSSQSNRSFVGDSHSHKKSNHYDDHTHTHGRNSFDSKDNNSKKTANKISSRNLVVPSAIMRNISDIAPHRNFAHSHEHFVPPTSMNRYLSVGKQHQSLNHSTGGYDFDSNDDENDKDEDRQENVFYKDQKDLIIPKKYLNRDGLEYLLHKIANKSNQMTIKAVSYSLSLQLLLEEIFEHGYIPTRLKDKIMKVVEATVHMFQDKSSNSYLIRQPQIKSRILYDISMCLMLTETRGGRNNIKTVQLHYLLHSSNLFPVLREKIETRSMPSQSFQQALIMLCDGKKIFNTLTDNLMIKRNTDQHELTQYFDTLISQWQVYHNNDITASPDNRSPSQCYEQIIQLQERLVGYQQHIKNRSTSLLYKSLVEKVKNLKKRMVDKLIVGFFANPLTAQLKGKNFMIKFDKMFARGKKDCRKNAAKEFDETFNVFRSAASFTNESETANNNENDEIPQFVVKMRLNKANLELLKKRGGCRNLIISAFTLNKNSQSIAAESESTNCENLEIIQMAALAKLINEIDFFNLFICISTKPSILVKALHESKLKPNLQVVSFQFDQYHLDLCKKQSSKSLPKQECYELTEMDKHLIMTNFCIECVKKVNQGQTIAEAVSEIKHNMQIYNNNKQPIVTAYPIHEVVKYNNQLPAAKQNKQIKMYLSDRMLVKTESMSAIIELMKIIKNDKETKSINLKMCEFREFIMDFEFYMFEKEGFNAFFTFMHNQDFLRKIYDENLLSAYYSHHKLILAWKQKPEGPAWVNSQLKRLHLDAENFSQYKYYAKSPKGTGVIKQIKKIKVHFKNQTHSSLIAVIDSVEQEGM